MDNAHKAIAIMIAGMLLIPVGDAFAKRASELAPYSGAAIAWARFLTGAAIVAPIALALGHFRGLGRAFLIAQSIRGVLLATAVAMIITGASTAPLADVFGAFFIAPAIATLLARVALGEHVTPIDWAAVALGFLGVMLVVKPGLSMNPGLLWALGAGCFYGAFLTATRWAAASGPPLAQLAGQFAISAILLSPIGLVEFARHGLVAPDLLLGSGVFSTVANLLSIAALALARAALLTPLVYCQLVSAAALGWFVFGDAPDWTAALGLGLIAAAGLSRFAAAARATAKV